MSAARWVAAALVVAGAAAGTFSPSGAAIVIAQTGGYYALAADFHVHAFPGDGALPSWELAREARRRGLHAIVVSNHNQTLAPRFGRRLLPESLPLVIPSQEVTTARFHLVAVGISQTVDWRLPDTELLDAIHAQGGAVIAAHPVGRYGRGSDAMLPRLDGVEIAHPLTNELETGRAELDAFFARVRAVNPTIAPIGSSDFHMVAPLGVCRTWVFAKSVTVDGVLDAIRAGRTVAEDQHGVRYGDPALVALLPSTPETSPQPRAIDVLSVALSLLGLLGLVILR